MAPINIGLQVQTFRHSKNLTVAKLARLANVSAANISRLESGKAEYPNLKTLECICNVLEITIPDLFPYKSIHLPGNQLQSETGNDLKSYIQLLENKLKNSKELVDFLMAQRY